MKRNIRKYLLIVMLSSLSILSSGQTRLNNPFGLVYRDAITENVSGEVNIHPVDFKLNGIEIRCLKTIT